MPEAVHPLTMVVLAHKLDLTPLAALALTTVVEVCALKAGIEPIQLVAMALNDDDVGAYVAKVCTDTMTPELLKELQDAHP